MATIEAQIKRGFLQCLYDCSVDNAKPLLSVLKDFQKKGFEGVRQGLLLTSTSGNGHSSSFAMPAFGMQLTQDQIFSLAQEFREVYNDAIATLSGLGFPNPYDSSIFSTMNSDDRLQTITEFKNDYSLTYWPSSF